jgi:hypothetical protein
MDSYHSLNEARRAQLYRVADAATQDGTVSGKNLIHGLGKTFFHVDFPVMFSGEPVFHYGTVLDPRNPFAVLGGSFRCTATIAGFDVDGKIDGAFDGYYTGATIASFVDGTEGQLTWVHWSFHGPALRNPVDDANVEIL